MSKQDADRYRKMADECRAQAAKSVSVPDKERWLGLAEEWLKLAQAADRSHDG